MSRKPAEFQNHPATFLEAKDWGAYRAVCRHVVDGDTYDFFVDLGLFQYAYIPVRLKGIDTPEVYGVNASEQGRAAKAFAEELLIGKPCMLYTGKDPTTFGRFVAHVEVWRNEQWADIGTLLFQAGYA